MQTEFHTLKCNYWIQVNIITRYQVSIKGSMASINLNALVNRPIAYICVARQDKPWTYYKWTFIDLLMYSCTCQGEKRHKSILHMLLRFADVMAAASVRERSYTVVRDKLQTTCTVDNRSFKIIIGNSCAVLWFNGILS